MEEALVVNADSIKRTCEKLENPAKMADAVADIKKMISIKQALLWRADEGTRCGSLCNIAAALTHEIGILENVLEAIEKDNTSKAIHLMEEYEQILRSGRMENKSCQDH
jgi:hypothetical protein